MEPIKLTYGNVVTITNPRYEGKEFQFQRFEAGKAIIHFKGRSEKSRFNLVVNPAKIQPVSK